MITGVAKQRNVVKAAAALATAVAIPSIAGVGDDETLIGRLKAAQSSLLPVERAAMREMDLKVRALSHRLRDAKRVLKFGGYRKFSLEPLTWRDSRGFPRLAVFDVDRADAGIKVVLRRDSWRESQGVEWSPDLPKAVRDCYADVAALLRGMSKKARKSIALRTEFSGIIPVEVKAHIVRAKQEFKQVMIVAEAGRWDLEKTAPTVAKRDPLVVGWDGIDFWLVDAFDTTTLEEYVKSEFTTRVDV